MDNNVSWNQKFHWLYGIEEYLDFIDHPQSDKFKQIEDAILHGQPWAIRDLILDEINRGKVGLSEQFVNTILLDLLHADLPELDNRQLLQYIAHCIDCSFIRDISSWSIKWSETTNITDHFSRGQVASKLWMVEKLNEILENKQLGTIIMYGGWYATIAAVLFDHFDIKKYYNLDMDEHVLAVANDFNYKNLDKFKSQLCDVNTLVYQDNKCTLPDSTVVAPNVVINTSCEHMTDEWFYNLPDGQFVVLQTNNYFSNEQHINCVNSVAEAMEKYQFSEVLYAGELDNVLYYRYMIIGVK